MGIETSANDDNVSSGSLYFAEDEYFIIIH